MDTPSIKTEISNYIATVTIDRAPVNATVTRTFEEIQAAFDALNKRPDVRVAIFTGAGKCFCAGADLKARLQTIDIKVAHGPWGHMRAAREAFDAIIDCTVPVICAINGPALGAGLVLAACCDTLIASENALLGLPEIDVGILGGGRHTQRLFGVYKARKMMFTGERIGAAELYRLGVVEKVVPAGDLMNEARALAEVIAKKSTVAMGLAKQTMNTIEFMELRQGYRYEQGMTAVLSGSDEAKEATRSFVEKRDPEFKGS